jgi:signal transduction histidine kinase
VFTPLLEQSKYRTLLASLDGLRKIKLFATARCAHYAMIKGNITQLSQRYAKALRAYLRPGAPAGLEPALELGRQAVALEVGTLELSRMHEAALVALGLFGKKNANTRRAEMFFTEANALIEETHGAAQESKSRLKRAHAALGLRTKELAVSNRELEREVAQRKVMADAAEKNGHHYRKSLEESLQLQKRLRKLTHRVMVEQEDERKNISRELQNEIAQTLLGINVRLLSLKQHARSNTRSFKDEIASTQRLVLKSAQSVRRVAREIGHEPEDSSAP